MFIIAANDSLPKKEGIMILYDHVAQSKDLALVNEPFGWQLYNKHDLIAVNERRSCTRLASGRVVPQNLPVGATHLLTTSLLAALACRV